MRALGLTVAVLALAAGLFSRSGRASDLEVVATLKPIHSLVAGVMAGVAEPTLLIKGGGSPHSYSLRPSEARALSRADLVFWVGAEMEVFLERPLAALAGEAQVVALSRAPGIVLLESREGGAWDRHEEPGAQEEHGALEGHGAQEGHGERNMHIWLSPNNAAAIVRAAVAGLSAADPDEADRYRENGAALLKRIEAQSVELSGILAPVTAVPYVVFHDAYSYFEQHFGLRPLGSVTVNPERKPGARRLTEIRRKIVGLRAACVFSEPQFPPALVKTVIEGTVAKTGVLDPLGSELGSGPDAYFQIMSGLAKSLKACLAPAS